jgi:hypothetical protein
MHWFYNDECFLIETFIHYGINLYRHFHAVPQKKNVKGLCYGGLTIEKLLPTNIHRKYYLSSILIHNSVFINTALKF